MSKSTAIANPFSGHKKGPKTVDHVSVHRSMNGGHRIEQHFTGYEHPPESKEFGPGDRKKAAAHLMKAAGMDCEE